MCANAPETSENENGYNCEGSSEASPPAKGLCDCLKECSDCGCSDDTWVMLGCVELGSEGLLTANSDDSDENDVKLKVARRKYVKPIECHCPPTPPAEEPTEEPPADGTTLPPKYHDMHKRIERIEDAMKKAGAIPDG